MAKDDFGSVDDYLEFHFKTTRGKIHKGREKSKRSKEQAEVATMFDYQHLLTPNLPQHTNIYIVFFVVKQLNSLILFFALANND